MEFVLQAVVVVFMLFLCALCLFAVVVIARDIIHESAANKRAREAENNSNLKEPVQVVVQPVVSAPVVAAQPAAPAGCSGGYSEGAGSGKIARLLSAPHRCQ